MPALPPLLPALVAVVTHPYSISGKDSHALFLPVVLEAVAVASVSYAGGDEATASARCPPMVVGGASWQDPGGDPHSSGWVDLMAWTTGAPRFR